MNITINHSSQTPLYRQIKNQLRDMILKEELTDGTVMPSERAMAKLVGVHRNTIIKAYNELKADGFLEANQGSCYRVVYGDEYDGNGKVDRGGNQRRRAKSSVMAVNWESHIRREVLDMEMSFDELFSKSYQWAKISFAGGIAPKEAYKTDALNSILEGLAKDSNDDLYAYTPYQGSFELRQTLADFLGGKGMPVKPGEIQLLSEANQALDYLTELLVRPGDPVITEEPISPDVYREMTLAGAKVLTVPMDDEGMRADKIEPLIKRHNPRFIYVNSSYHDPTGVMMSLARRKKLLELAYQYRIPIIEEDGASELWFDEPAVPSLKALDTKNAVIYIYSFALTFAPGVRMSLVAGPKPVIKNLRQLISMRLIALDSLSQRLLLSYMKTGIYRESLVELRQLYKEKRDIMCGRLEEVKHLGVSYKKPKGGVYIWCRLPENMNGKALLQEAGKAGVTFIPGNVFFPNGTTGEQYIRLNYSYPGKEQIEQGMDILVEAMGKAVLDASEEDIADGRTKVAKESLDTLRKKYGI